MSSPKESQLWHDIRQAALDDKDLQDALDRVKVLYYLKQKEKPVMWHPV
jgi:DNA polymerase III sliding clamp (beta) subunit (PCNA family)